MNVSKDKIKAEALTTVKTPIQNPSVQEWITMDLLLGEITQEFLIIFACVGAETREI